MVHENDSNSNVENGDAKTNSDPSLEINGFDEILEG